MLDALERKRMLEFVNTVETPDPLPSIALHGDSTAYYVGRMNELMKHRSRVCEAMTWLHPVRRLIQKRELTRTDRQIRARAATVIASIDIDKRLGLVPDVTSLGRKQPATQTLPHEAEAVLAEVTPIANQPSESLEIGILTTLPSAVAGPQLVRESAN